MSVSGAKPKDKRKQSVDVKNDRLPVYRNIYFKKKILTNLKGNVTVYYTGNMYPDCDSIKDFAKRFDRSRDLLVSCNDCASRKYRKFVKIEK